MPIYEYRCTSCGHQLEVIQKMGERALRTCTRCKGKLEKLVSRAAFQLKGGGWYSEGYSRSDANSGADKPADASRPADSKSGDAPPSTDKSPRKAAAS